MTAEYAVPAVPPLRRPKLPTVAERTLGNGLRVLAVRKPGIPMVQARLNLPTARPKPGPADQATERVLSGTLLSGTARRSSVQVAEALQRIGGTLDAVADNEDLRLRGSVLAPSLPALLDLMAEVLTEAAFPKSEVEVERARIAQEVRLQEANPSVLARVALLKRVYGDHPYGDGLPGMEEIAAVSAADLRRYVRNRVGPRDGFLILVGDVRPAKALDAVERILGGWADGRAARRLPQPPPIEPGPVVLVDRPGAAQSNIRLAGPALTRADAGLPALLVANTIFGGYFSSRLVGNIREQKGYTYSPRSSLEHEQVASLLIVAADVGTEVTAPALLEIRYELGRMATLPVGADELEAAKRYLVGTTMLSTQTQAGLANYLFALTRTGLDLGYLRDLPGRLAAVTVDDVAEVAATHLAPHRLVTVVLGDAASVRGPLATLDEIGEGHIVKRP